MEWAETVLENLKELDVRLMTYVPDNMLIPLIDGAKDDPHWTAFTIGYHIVHGFLRQHPHTSWPAVAADEPFTIMSGSHYQPCPH